MKALVLSGDGINCETETAEACADAGFLPRIIHINDLLIEKQKVFEDVKLFVIPGGFSFGDELGSGKILALKLKHGLGESLDRHIERGGAVLGICNGFQVLTRLGVFGRDVVLAQNVQGHFQNRWAKLQITGFSIFTDHLKNSGVEFLDLPIRHGEGRLCFKNESDARAKLSQGECVLRYTEDVNGSWERVAGLSAHGGRVMGLMPHPEAFWCAELHPDAHFTVPLGVELFKGAFQYFKKGANS